jgi:hypothetical protein
MLDVRTTVKLNDDLMGAIKHRAQHERKTVSEVLSDIVRESFKPKGQSPRRRNGLLLLPVQPGAVPATLELVNRLRDEEFLD